MRRNNQYYLRKTHRYLGILIAIQFVAWTVSGLYFSWNDIDDVHGDHMRKNPKYLSSNTNVVSPSLAIENLKASTAVDSVHSVMLISILGQPVYQIRYFSGHTHGIHPHVHYALADAQNGLLQKPLTKDQATLVAKDHVPLDAKVIEVSFLEKTDDHHEYRERPLPAWAVSFEDPDCTVYISADQGTFQTIRHDQWRAFDFLWMFHTMDYQGRDDFNNWLLKIFSIVGLLTVCSGIFLFILTARIK
jgi:hypothetical protein